MGGTGGVLPMQRIAPEILHWELSFTIKVGYQWVCSMFASTPIFCAGEGRLCARRLAWQGTLRLALLWLLCFTVPGWAATPAPVTVVDVMVLYTPQARGGAGD